MEPISTLLFYLLSLYALMVVSFLIMENRSPHSTFAWMLLFAIFPVGGVMIYFFFGRDWKAFSRENKLVRQELGRDLTRTLAPILSQQGAEIQKLQQADVPCYNKKLLELVRRSATSVLTVHNQVEILQNASQKYPRLIEDIEQATSSIHLQYYLWASDPFTERLKNLLIDKLEQGVEIRLLYDPIGSLLELSYRYVREMRAAGIKMYPFSPIYKLHTIGYRNHRKIAVIDGKVGYTGGLNIGQEHLDGGRGFSSWRDTHTRLTGEAAQMLQGIFVTDWYNATYEKLSDQRYFPSVVDECDLYLPIQITTSGPDSRWEAIRQLYFFMILAAERRIYLQSPFFIPDASISEALRTVALSGVEVKLMLAPRGDGNQTPYWAANTYIQEMAAAGIEVFLYQKGYFHSKTLNIDSAICSIGSANMDIRSFSINYEANVVIYDEKTAKKLEQDFLDDLKHCAQFSLTRYKKSNPIYRFRDSVARLFSPLL